VIDFPAVSPRIGHLDFREVEDARISVCGFTKAASPPPPFASSEILEVKGDFPAIADVIFPLSPSTRSIQRLRGYLFFVLCRGMVAAHHLLSPVSCFHGYRPDPSCVLPLNRYQFRHPPFHVP